MFRLRRQVDVSVQRTPSQSDSVAGFAHFRGPRSYLRLSVLTTVVLYFNITIAIMIIIIIIILLRWAAIFSPSSMTVTFIRISACEKQGHRFGHSYCNNIYVYNIIQYLFTSGTAATENPTKKHAEYYGQRNNIITRVPS